MLKAENTTKMDTKLMLNRKFANVSQIIWHYYRPNMESSQNQKTI